MIGLDAGQHEHIEDQVVQSVGLFFDAAEESLVRFGVHGGRAAERFGVRLDRAERRFEFVRDVGDEVAANGFEAAEFGRVVNDEHDAGARLAGQRLDVDINMEQRGAGAIGFKSLRFAGGESVRDSRVKCVVADDFEQRAAFDGDGLEAVQPAGCGVGENDAEALVDRDDAFDHAAERGRLAGGRLAKLCHSLAEREADAIERAGEGAELVAVRHVNALLVVAGGDGLGGGVERGDRANDAADEPDRRAANTQSDSRAIARQTQRHIAGGSPT